MVSYPISGSTLDQKISTGLSTQIIIKVGNVTVGAIQDLTINQNRDVKEVGEVGLDGFLELVPNSPTKFTADLNRIVYDRLRLTESFARGFVNIHAQLIPFDIDIIDRTNGDGDGAITHTLVECWFTSYKPSYKQSDYILTENAGIKFRTIRSVYGTSNSNVAQGGARGLSYQINDRERKADIGNYMGTLDVSNLINQVFQ